MDELDLLRGIGRGTPVQDSTKEAARRRLHARIDATASRRAPRLALALTAVVAVVVAVVGSGAALAVAEVMAQAIGVPSRAVSLERARGETALPLPRGTELPGGWRLREVQLTTAESWRAVNLQYLRAGARGLGVHVWSEGIQVVPSSEREERVEVAGVPVTMSYQSDWRTASFRHLGSLVLISANEEDVSREALAEIVAAWIGAAR